MLPHGLITVSLVTALYTRLSEAASRGDHDEVMRLHGRGLRLPSVILVPGVVLIGVLAPYVASTFFFTNTLQETKAIAIVLQGLVWMVLPMAWTYLNDRVFYAHQMTFMSFRIQCVTTGLSSLGALVASRLDPGLTAFALSLGQSCAVVVSSAVGFWVLKRMHGHIGLRSAGRDVPQAPRARRASPPWRSRGSSPWPCPTSASAAGWAASSRAASSSASRRSSSSPSPGAWPAPWASPRSPRRSSP